MPQARLTKDELLRLNLSEKLILFYRKYPVRAAKDLLGVELTWFQRKALRGLWFKKNNLLLMSRGIGKTWLLALFAVLYAMLYPGVMIGVITPSYKQTEFLFDKISDFYEESPYLRASVNGKIQRTTFKALTKFHNRSFIEGLPLGTGQKIRGRRYNIILIDEYAQVSEDIVKTVVRPMMNVKKKGIENKYIISSTAYYTWNHFYLQYLLYSLMSVKNPDLYGLHEYTFEDLQMMDEKPFELDEDVYEMMRMDTTEEIYDMENRCKFPVENVGFFSMRLIDSCTPKRTIDTQECPIELFGDPLCNYTMGIDAARVAGGDNFAISVIKMKNGIKQVVFVKTLNGKTYQTMISWIRRVLLQFPNITRIYVDAAGGGTTIKDLLTQPFETEDGAILMPILDIDDKEHENKVGMKMLRMVNFTRPVVNDLYVRLKADMQHKTIEFPLDLRRSANEDLEQAGQEILSTKRELLVLQAEGKGNYYTFDVPNQFKKDRATALALAVQAANHILDNVEEEVGAELATGDWIR